MTMRMCVVAVVASVLACGVSCGGKERGAASEAAPGASASAALGATPSASRSSSGSDDTLPAGDWHLPPPGKRCAATGVWGPCTLLERLDRSGLAPRVAADTVREPPLQQSGHLVRLGSAELKVFLYPDSASRLQDEARLDKRRYIEAAQDPTLRNEATIIRSGNLLAILSSRSETQRERVSLAITAGPPQARP